jgi:hypothetical protein
MAYESASQSGHGSASSVIHTDASHPDVVSISDAELLFTGHLERKGPDLVLTGHDGRHHIIPGYFSAEHHADLVAPNGARITGDLVDLLAGSPAPGQYAQAQSAVPTNAIGRIEKVVGDVTVMRNGVAVALHVGDAVYKNDVVQTGADSSAGIGFPDGTALNLVANTRMALNDYAYDPNGTSNDALFNLVQGGFAFVAGKVAHTGDMKIGTPVATMGIRGTTGYALEQVAAVNANAGNVTMSFAVVADPGSDRVGLYDLIDQFGNVVAQVGRAGIWTNVQYQGASQPPSVFYTQMTASNFAVEQALVPALVQILNSINTQNLNPTPQSGPNSPGSSTPPIFLQLINLQQNLQQNSGTPLPISVQVNSANGPTTTAGTATITTTPNSSATSTVKWISQFSGTWETPTNWSDFIRPAAPQFININQPIKVTIGASESAYGLTIGAGAILNIISGGALELHSGIANFGQLQINSSGSDPTLAINGTVYLLNGGTIALTGPTAENFIIGVAGTGATLVNVNNTIIGSGTIGQGDGALSLVNGADGTIEAKPLGGADSGLLVIDTGRVVSNSGLMTAVDGGTLQIADRVTNFDLIQASDDGTILLADHVRNSGTIGASGTNAIVGLEAAHIAGGTVETDTGGVIETLTGKSSFWNVTLAAGSFIDTDTHTVLRLERSTVLDGTVTFEGEGKFKLTGADPEIVGKGNAAAELDNDGTISGGGKIGDGDEHFALVNEASGVIDATGHRALIIDNDSPGSASTQPGNAVINTGLIEARGVGGLTIENTTISNATNAAHDTGRVDVLANSQITLDNATILHGFVSIAAGGAMLTVSGTSNTIETAFGQDNLSTPTISNAGTLSIGDGSSLTLASPDAIDNSGTISLNSTGDATYLYFDQPDAGINGGGHIMLSANANNFIAVTQTGDQLTNFDNTISGSGTIGAGGMVLINDGVIDADQQSAALTLDPTSLTNAGTLEATNGSTLTLNVDSLTNDSGAKIIAADGSNFNVTDTSSTNLGIYEATDHSTMTLNQEGTSINEAGGIIEAIDATIVLNANPSDANYGTIDAVDHGTIDLNVAGTNATPQGGNHGLIEVLSGSDFIVNGGFFNWSGANVAAGGPLSLVEFAGGSGAGVTNDGTITAADNGEVLFQAVGLVINANTITAISDGIVEFVDTTVNNSGGTIAAADAGASIQLSHATINSGTLSIGAGTDLEIAGSSEINQAAISGGGLVQIDSGQTLTLEGGASITGGTVDVHGTIAVSSGNTAKIDVDTVRVESGGQIKVDGAGSTLMISENLPGSENYGTIDASNGGTITINHLLTNNGGTYTAATATTEIGGIIEADSGTLTINSLEGDANLGTIKAIDGGTLTLNVALNPNYTGGGGNEAGATMEALSGGTFSYSGDADNASGAIIAASGTGSTFEFSLGNYPVGTATEIFNAGSISASSAGTVEFSGAATNTLLIDNVGGDIAAHGAGSTIQLSNVAIGGGMLTTDDRTLGDAGLIEIVAPPLGDSNTTFFDGATTGPDHPGPLTVDAFVQVNSGANLELSGTIDNLGTIDVDAGVNPANLEISGTVLLEGAGQVTLDGASDSIIGASGGGILDNINDTISGAGTIGTGGSGSICQVDNGGVIDADLQNESLTLDPTLLTTNTGTLEATNGGELIVSGTVYNCNGTVGAYSAGYVDFQSAITGGSAIIDGGVLEYGSSASVSTSFDGPGTLVLDGTNETSHFTGVVSGFGDGDVIDLAGIPDTLGTYLIYNPHSQTLTVSNFFDGDSVSVNLSGGSYSSLDFLLSPDGNGTDVTFFNPIFATNSYQTVSGTYNVAGNISFVDLDLNPHYSATFTPDGPGYVGDFSLDPVNKSFGGGMEEWNFTLGNDRIPKANETLTQSYQLSVSDGRGSTLSETASISIGGPGADNFVFHPGIGADTIVNFNAGDTIELDHFANIQSVQQLASLITTDAHGDPVIELGHNDSITLLGLTTAQLHAQLHSLVHLN